MDADVERLMDQVRDRDELLVAAQGEIERLKIELEAAMETIARADEELPEMRRESDRLTRGYADLLDELMRFTECGEAQKHRIELLHRGLDCVCRSCKARSVLDKIGVPR